MGEDEGFGQSPEGPVRRLRLSGHGGATAEVLTWGAALRDLRVPLRDGRRQPVTLGFDNLAPYLDNPGYVGVLVGRVANRISGGRFTLDGHSYDLDRNEGGRATLHGGAGGISRRLWAVVDQSPSSVTLELVSADGDQGFPGRLTTRCRYALEPGPSFVVDLHATCDRPCPVNLTQHAYFNLDGSADISGHRLTVHAGHVLPVDAALIPTGAPVPVDGTALDLRQPTGLDRTPPLDTCYVLDGDATRPAARLESPRTGLAMEVVTTKPTLQVYDARHLSMAPFGPRAGLCLETQFLPDSPNRPEFPDITLRPGSSYRQRTAFRFAWM